MPDDVVELNYHLDEAGAWLARAVLQANGIPSQVIGLHPAFGHGNRVRLAVRAQDIDAAFRLLSSPSERPSA